ncbi:hypothetical protein [Kitasatospora sp. NPDC096140]
MSATPESSKDWHVSDDDLQRLHRTGLAQEFDMGGAGKARTRKG